MPEQDTGNIASTRSSRKSQDRPKVWTPPNKLETPPPPEGKVYRWVRYSASGDLDDSNVYERYRQGYRPVMRSELDGWTGDELREGRGDHAPEGTVKQGDLILMEVDEDIANQRNDYYTKQTRAMQRAVDQELESMNSPNMPIIRDHSTQVSTGAARRNANIDDD